MRSQRRSSHTSFRAGFTLLELVVAMALTVILGLIAFTGQRFMVNVIARTSERTTTRANMSLVLDQLTKELREASTVNDGVGTNDGSRGTFSVTLPDPTVDATRSLVDVLAGTSSTPPLTAGQSYTFPISPTDGVLEFFTVDDAGVKHRIRYSLALPMTSGGVYAGLGASNWVRPDWQPCCVIYRNNKWVGGAWTTESPRIVTDQVVTDFSATRVPWSNNVIQIAISAYARNLSGGGSSLMTLVSLVTLRR
ncbi:MAG: prepilin-type N-terminal cleavage/methylation domain-containing protein [Caldiserica bacterium]|nr:prepilin-type N-terminal cleavage/methylation domain-containing protein [Caldisericota bacterium]